MLEKLSEICERTRVTAAEVGRAISRIIETQTRGQSQNASFWSTASEMPKAQQACEKITQDTAELKQKLYSQLGQEAQETTNIEFGK